MIRGDMRGWPLSWTDRELDALSRVSVTDIRQANELWVERAPRPVKELLDAVLLRPEQPPV